MEKYSRNCPSCDNKIEYLRKYDLNQANKINKKCYSCKMKEKSSSGSLTRNCPGCDTLITYTNKGNRNAAEKINKKCLKCTKNEDRGITEFKKECLGCNNTIYFKNKVSLDESLEKNAKCKKCVSKRASIEQKEKGGNQGMMIAKYGKEIGEQKFKESEEKRKASFKKYWEEHPEQLQSLINKREGFKSKFFDVGGLKCQGNSEKQYVESLIKENKPLPSRSLGIITPYGYCFPDFEFENEYIEVKSPYTYRLFKKENCLQYLKMKWVADNLKPVRIICVDSRKYVIEETEIIHKSL